jgi:RNA polymerase sigma-70 factor (ECF subfamily)
MEYSTHSDDELLTIFKTGEIKGFNALFDRHWKPLYFMARKILEDEDLAKDTVQETFVALYQAAGRTEIVHIKSWLFQTVKYQCFMHLRSGKISEKHLNRIQQIYSANYVDEYMDAEELEGLLLRQLDSLPEKCREVFYLSRYQMMSNKKIAEQLNISQKTVEHQITKALRTIRLSLDKLAILALLMPF